MKLDVCGEMTDTDLIDLVTNEDIHSENEKQNTEDNSRQVPKQAALMEALDVIHTFYQTAKAPVTTDDLMSYQQVENSVLKHRAAKITQTTIDSFFKK
jgi:hypothetical protein